MQENVFANMNTLDGYDNVLTIYYNPNSAHIREIELKIKDKYEH